jgi:predicted amidohydrolase
MIARSSADEPRDARACAVALVQLAVADGEPARNLARAEAMVQSAPAADLYVLPELFTTGYAHAGWPAAADAHTPLALDAMRRWASQRRAWVAGSVIARRGDGALVNRLAVFAPDGVPLADAPPAAARPGPAAFYDKAHLFPPMHEPAHLAAGEARVRTEVAGVAAALSICFDLRFPEMYRLDAAAGAELFIVASAWPNPRGEALRLFARARAAENQATLVLCNRTGAGADGTTFAGGSCVVGPDGAVLADAGAREGIVICETDLAASARLRARFPVLPLRRPQVDWETDDREPARLDASLDPSVAALALEGMRARLMTPRGTPCADEQPPALPRPADREQRLTS